MHFLDVDWPMLKSELAQVINLFPFVMLGVDPNVATCQKLALAYISAPTRVSKLSRSLWETT